MQVWTYVDLMWCVQIIVPKSVYLLLPWSTYLTYSQKFAWQTQSQCKGPSWLVQEEFLSRHTVRLPFLLMALPGGAEY